MERSWDSSGGRGPGADAAGQAGRVRRAKARVERFRPSRAQRAPRSGGRFYEKLASYAVEAKKKLSDTGSLDSRRGPRIRDYFEALGAHASTLESIARAELAGESFTESQTIFLKNILQTWHNCDGTLLFDGWYPQLVFDIGFNNAETFEPTMADVHTGTDETRTQPRILHVGVGHPSMMLISILNECGLKAYVGPVLSYHELITGGERLTDEEWKASLEAGSGGARPAWTSSFVR